jgi:hypothetical protein
MSLIPPVRLPTADPPPKVRFEPEHRSQVLRIAVGSRLLIGAGSTVFWLLGRLGGRKMIHCAERIWARAVTRLLELRLDITGVENIAARQRYVVVALHEGFADAVALLRLPLALRFAVRDELFEWSALGRYLRATEQIRVDEPATRSSLRDMYRQIETSLASGDSLVVFAQRSTVWRSPSSRGRSASPAGSAFRFCRW